VAKSNKKGADFERSICKMLSLWFSHGKQEDIFWRTAGSGARATTRAKKGLSTSDHAGDICAIDIVGKPLTDIVLFELKRGYSSKTPSKSISLIAFIDKLSKEKDPILLKWMDKLDEETKTHGRKFWLCIFKRDRKQAVIGMMKSTFDYINDRNVNRYIWPPFGPSADIYIKSKIFRFMLFEDFLKWATPEGITRKIKRRGEPITQKQWENISKTWVPVKKQEQNQKPRKIKRRLDI
jgi:hypothetical protein